MKWPMDYPMVTYMIDDFTLPRKVKLVTTPNPNTLRAQYLDNSWRCNLVTGLIANL